MINKILDVLLNTESIRNKREALIKEKGQCEFYPYLCEGLKTDFISAIIGTHCYAEFGKTYIGIRNPYCKLLKEINNLDENATQNNQ